MERGAAMRRAGFHLRIFKSIFRNRESTTSFSSHQPFLEPLETRTAPAVTFTASPFTLTEVNGEATPGLFFGGPIEPTVSVNPKDPGNVVISSQDGLQVSTNGG